MEKTALVLAGGGSRGAYQIGVWQALIELNIDINIVTGTSVGALNAALICSGDFQCAMDMWRGLKTSMIVDVEIDELLPKDQALRQLTKRFLQNYVTKGGTDSYPLKALIDETVDEDRVRNSPIECGFVVVDKSTLRPLEMYVDQVELGQLSDYLLASSSLFPAIQSCKIGDKTFIDGGYYDNLPVELALKRGATRVIAVDLDAIGIKRKAAIKKATDLTVIKSYWGLGPLLIFDKDTINRNMRLGYLDTMKAFGVFSGIAYTFIKNAIAEFAAQNRDFVRQFNDTVGLNFQSKSIKENLFFVSISNQLKMKYGWGNGVKYSAFLTGCVETAGEALGIDPTKIYSFDSFKLEIIKTINTIEVPYIKPLDSGGIKAALAILDKKVRISYLAHTIKKALRDKNVIDSIYLVLFLPDEFLAAYYLAMID